MTLGCPVVSLASLVFCVACLPRALTLYDATLDFRDPSSIAMKRSNLCDRVEAVHNDSTGIEDALRGLHINIVTTLYSPMWFDEPINNTDPEKMTGFHAELAAALAERAGFTYTIYSHPISSFQPGLSWNDYLEEAVQKYDISADWWLATNQRAKKGIRAPHDFLDLSLMTARYGEEAEADFWGEFFQFADPLTPALWLTFAAISMATSLLYLALEARVEDGDFDSSSSFYFKVLKTIWIGFVQFTGAGGFSPRTGSGKLLVLTYSMLILLLVSAYTANLAAFLTVQRGAVSCQSLEDCVRTGQRVCVWQGTASDSWVTDEYVELEKSGQIVRCQSQPWVCALNEQCSLVVQPMMSYELALRSKDNNPDCAMARVDVDTLRYFGGGWMSRVEYSTMCTSLLIDTLSSHMLALQSEGQLETLVQKLYSRSTTQTSCSKEDGEFDDTTSLPVSAMGGAMLLHGSVWGILLLVFCCRRLWERVNCHRGTDKAPSKDINGKAEAGVCRNEETLHDIQMDLHALQAQAASLAAKVASLALSHGSQERQHEPDPQQPVAHADVVRADVMI